MEADDRRLLAAAVISAAVVALSVLIGVVGGELSSWLWVLLVPVGTFGAGLVFVGSFGALVVRRLRA